MLAKVVPGAAGNGRHQRPAIDSRALQEYALRVHKIPVGVLGASGYAGRELCAIVNSHPGLELAFASAGGQAGKTARLGNRDVTFVASDDVPLDRAELVFSALPHGASALWVERAHGAGARVVDLSADLRPGNDVVPAALGSAVPYGLPEALRSGLDGASVVANPGCYPTAILLALQPLAVSGRVLPGASINNLNEMRAMMGDWKVDADLIFTPHLLPVARGILATITVPLAQPLDEGVDPAGMWREFYAGEPFVEITDALPELRDVVRRNVVRIAVRRAANVRTPTLIVIAAIDNLVKGAAGQAVQNANILLGLPETTGLAL